MIHGGKKANISLVSMALSTVHCSSWLKTEKRKQQKASDPAVGDDGIRDYLNENPAVPQSGADGCST